MLSLNQVIEQYGEPDILIDNNCSKVGYALWGIEDKIDYFYGQSITDKDPIERLNKTIQKWIKSESEISAVGYISYDIKNIIYPQLNFKSIPNEPLYWFVKPKKIIRYMIKNENTYTKNSNCIDLVEDILSKREYLSIMKKIKKELKQGNVYQINMTMTKKYKIKIDPFLLYLLVRKIAKPEFGYYIKNKEESILSFSPEQFFCIKDNIIKTYPMKGTRPRSKNLSKDKKLKIELTKSKKDKAEHLMIVDLMRNDIGKICKYGTVKVDNLFNVNSYETVHQMVSCVYGELKNNVNYVDIIKALFPGGSVTGAPKESAMKIIDYLEEYNRGPYTGGIGYFTSDGSINFNMAIRTLIIKNMIGKYCVGGGIVWDSVPNDEWEEAQLKSKILDII